MLRVWLEEIQMRDTFSTYGRFQLEKNYAAEAAEHRFLENIRQNKNNDSFPSQQMHFVNYTVISFICILYEDVI